MGRLAVIVAAVVSLASLHVSCHRPLREAAETRDMMGTLVTITVRHADLSEARQAMEVAFAEIDRVERLMSTYDDDSEISRLNREGTLEVSRDTANVLRHALRVTEVSGGAFDATVLPLLDLFRESFDRDGSPPAAREVDVALARVGPGRVRMEGTVVHLDEGTRITLDGIAKGYAIDRGIEILEERGVRHALVEAGGDVRALGSRGDRPWNIALRNPRDRADYLAVIPLEGNAVATSGDYERFFEPSLEYHHIIDPRTGASARELTSVTVVAGTAMEADSLATAVFVLGPESGMVLLEERDGVEALLVTAEREVLSTGGLEVRPKDRDAP